MLRQVVVDSSFCGVVVPDVWLQLFELLLLGIVFNLLKAVTFFLLLHPDVLFVGALYTHFVVLCLQLHIYVRFLCKRVIDVLNSRVL